MFRYVAFLWNPALPDQARAASQLKDKFQSLCGDWHPVFERNGLHVACAGESSSSLCAQRLHGDAGVILGTLFERHRDPLDDAPMRRASLGQRESTAIVSTNAGDLIRNYWGSYVAFLFEAAQVTIVLAPTGVLPLLLVHHQGMTVMFSCIADAIALGVLRSSVSHIYVRDRVLGRPIGSDNSLHGLIRLHRGEGLRFHLAPADSVIDRRLYWQPLQFAESDDAIEDPQYAARAIRSTIRACAHTLAACHRHALLRLSGGLDSSIIAGSLRDVSPRRSITCHTYFMSTNPADVRPWARRAAEHGGHELIECPIDPATMDLQAMSDLQPSGDVVSRLEYLGRSLLERALCEARGATAIFTGDGGDSGFCSDSIALAVIEYWKRHSLGPRTLRLATQVSLNTHRTTWHVLATSWRRWRRGATMQDLQNTRERVSQLVHPDIVHLAACDVRYEHPWFDDRIDVPWATIYRLGALSQPPQFYDLSVAPDAPAPEILHPLFAQPVVELLLRIPLYVHFDGGRDRGLARRAFAQDAPAENLQRLWKDRAPGFFSGLVDRHADWLRETFLDGVLIKERFLDRAAVEAALSSTPSKSTVNPAEILRHLDVELWARQWQ